uniref:O-fucosyltransferase family protein n=1 Tax=Salix viminalis TaxID=40686 RepID=A0A6N2KTQ5_SALVM
MNMAFKSKIKWIALFVLILSMVSLVIHLFITKLSGPYSLQSTLMPAIGFNLTPSIFGMQGDRVVRNKGSWGHVKSLESLQPYANPRRSYPVPNEKNNGYIYAKVFGGFEKIRSSICDLVTISRLLNATLVIPEIQESLQSKGISYKFKSFSYLYDEEQFIASLKNDVIVVNSLPENLKAGRRRNEIHTYKPKSSASPDFYVNEILPELKKSKVIGLVLHDGGCLQSILPPRCLSFRGLDAGCIPCSKFRPKIQYRRAQMIKQGILNDDLSVDSHVRRSNGSCPLMPDEIGLLLKEMGYSTETVIYVAGSETFVVNAFNPLRANFSNTMDRTQVLASSLPHLQTDPSINMKKKVEQTFICNLRNQATVTLDALDYIVSVEAMHLSGFHNDGSGWPDFSSLVMGHRLYESASSKTYRPDRRVLAELFNIIHDNLYHHNNHTWKRVVREHLNKSLSEDGLIRQSLLSKPTTFLSHPLPECSCRIPSAEVPKQVKGNDGRFLYGGEDECPRWMQLSQEDDTRSESAVAEEGSDDNSESVYKNDGVEQQESDESRGRSSLTQIPVDKDDEWDPND